jgi:ABC-2 family transporter protein
MNPTFTIAALTIKEAVRRRLMLAFIGIIVVIVGLSAWGFDRLSHTRSLTSGETNLAVPQALILFMFMFSFVLALSASAIASPSISSEIESGVLMTIVTRPIRRTEVLIGKWLGLAALLALYAGGVCALEFGVVDWASGFVPPNPVLVTVYLFAEGALLLTLALFLSTRVCDRRGRHRRGGLRRRMARRSGGRARQRTQRRRASNGRANRTIPAAHRRAVARRHLLPPTALAHCPAPRRRWKARSVLRPRSPILGLPALGGLLVPHRPARGAGELRASRALKTGTSQCSEHSHRRVSRKCGEPLLLSRLEVGVGTGRVVGDVDDLVDFGHRLGDRHFDALAERDCGHAAALAASS